MTKRRHRARRGAVPPGAWLAFLALAIQVLAPFFIAGDLALASTRTGTEDTIVICSALGAKAVPAPKREGNHHRHGILNGCPICTALAAGQSVTLPEPPTLPVPQTEAIVSLHATFGPSTSRFDAAAYNSRAPPSTA